MYTQSSEPKQYKLFAYVGRVGNMKDVVLKEAARKAIQKMSKK